VNVEEPREELLGDDLDPDHESDLNLLRFYYGKLLMILEGKAHILTEREGESLRSVGFIVRNAPLAAYELTPRFYLLFEEVRKERLREKRSKSLSYLAKMGKAEYKHKRDSAKWAHT
jgi:hypothetical protein